MSDLFIDDQAALIYLKGWAVDEYERRTHADHLMIERAYEQVSEQLARLEGLMH